MSEALTESGRYLATLGRDHRRTNGVVYTPDTLVSLVLDQEFGTGGAPQGPVLDPACGAGAFVVGIIARIAAHMSGQGARIDTGRDRQLFLAEIERLVWAIDVDPDAVKLTLKEVRGLVDRLAPGPLSTHFLTRNITVDDYLRRDSSPSARLYRHVVGNPPYVPIERINQESRKAYREQFVAAVGRVDLYYLFMERSIDVLQPSGSWTFITPDKFLSNRTAQSLRTTLASRGSIRTLSRFSSHSIFPDAATIPCITTWVKSDRLAAIHRRIELNGNGADVTEESHVPRAAFQDASWTFHGASTAPLLEAILADHPTLADHTTRISAGPATGYNPAFILDEKTAATLDDELIHPTARGRDVGRFTIRATGSRMLLPYVWDAAGACSLVDLDDYPRTRRWLVRHKTPLRARHAVRSWGKAWWDMHDPISLPLHRTAKLLVPDVAKRNRFALDDAEYVPQHSAYFLLPHKIDPGVLVSILNSEPVELAMRTTAPLVKDGFSRYRRQYLLDLPIPTPTAQQADRIRQAAYGDTPEVAAILAGALFNVDASAVRTALDNLPR